MKMDGSGQARELKLDQQLKETLATGVIPEGTTKLNLTTVKLPR